MGLGTADIDVMLSDLEAAGATVDVSIGADTVQGLRDHEAREFLGEEMPGVLSSEKSVFVKTGALSGLVSGASITVDGDSYVVREAPPFGDGEMTQIALRTA